MEIISEQVKKFIGNKEILKGRRNACMSVSRLIWK